MTGPDRPHRRYDRLERQLQIPRCAIRPAAPTAMSTPTLSSSCSADPAASVQLAKAIEMPTEAAGPKSFLMDLPLLENRFQFQRWLKED